MRTDSDAGWGCPMPQAHSWNVNTLAEAPTRGDLRQGGILSLEARTEDGEAQRARGSVQLCGAPTAALSSCIQLPGQRKKKIFY